MDDSLESYREILHEHLRASAEKLFDTEEEVETFLKILYSGPTTGEAMAARLREARRSSSPMGGSTLVSPMWSTGMHFDFRVTHIRRVIDGDTFDFEVDLGFHARTTKRFRLAGIDTAEIWGSNAEPAGTEQRDWVSEWLHDMQREGELRIRTFPLNWNVPLADGGFGRWAAIVYEARSMLFLSDALVAEGFEKLGEPLWIWDNVREIQEEMRSMHHLTSSTDYELTSGGDLKPREE